MKKDDLVYLRHILDSIEKIQRYLQGVLKEDFDQNSMLQDAVIRQIEIIGEAARNVSEEFKEKNPEIPWLMMTGMRNKLIHEYFAVNSSIVWDTIMGDLPVLKQQIQKRLD